VKLPFRVSVPTLRLLASLLERPSHWHYGYDLCQQTGLRSGTLYPILIRLHERGLLETDWEEPSAPGRPPRHVYKLTGDGVRAAQDALRAHAGRLDLARSAYQKGQA
jgi:PadR family transcriptional regulator PadR